ncbi:MAG: DUF3880 domain-containing protein [Lachnospiraceae bacterium]|nr:DUF3880 domain-containing protein [Lachnospiraceae bacterium]
MRILFLEWKSIGNMDMIEAFQACGHEVKCIPFSNEGVRRSEKTEQLIINNIREYSPDFVFSFNYFPLVSISCKTCGIAYVSWTYDNPYVMLYSYTILYEKNYIFVFDKSLYLEFHNAGIHTVYYLPLAANPFRLSKLNLDQVFLKSPYAPQTGISFVGSLYNEQHNFFDRLEGISSYTRGYLEGLMSAQMQVYSVNFIQDSLPKDILDDMHKSLPLTPAPDGIESPEYLYAQYVINRHITSVERNKYLTNIASTYGLDLYTHNNKVQMNGCINHGEVDYYDMAPYVFRHSRINLNLSLRSIHTGIPLRCFDIIGAGGFLLSNFQTDFADCFIENKDYVSFSGYQDMMDKIAYYLKHEDECNDIKKSGFQTLSENHTYIHRVNEMISYLK